MAQSYFIWKGIDCRDMGVKLSGPVPIIRPEERVQHVEIPGRSGDLTELEGTQVYNSYIQTATIMVQGGYRVREIYNWLKGSGYVTFHGEPDRKQAARIVGAITLNKHSRNLDWWVGEVQFYCQPLKQKLTEDTVTVTSSGTAVINAGDVESRPKITAKANASSMTITIGGKSLTITGLTSGSEYIIDSEIMEVSNAARTALITKDSVGSFPMLAPGSNTITGSGWSKLVIDRRERFL
ncbi:phage tail domain-containing protein [Aristaeella lactis]|uniref:Phage-related protein n=1 Tax=Aristaeella lactis TaxID=3046383 RepID=A0AC61PIK3_9FIRM|nr:phage tail domain-containing protein [Aristaeella lactis]QUA53794.1 phage tail family protein [Aristaeella lactis]SMC39542.1 Phage-related protein [Aristaeella lactis]